jgi:cbb3-type cytochrome c oxidase subunit III
MRLAQRMVLGAGGAALIALTLGGCKAQNDQASAGGDGTAEVENVALRPFTGDLTQAKRGRFLFITENCYGCHGGLAGGAMGPSLRDTVWKYGGSDEQIFASIHDGRPMGMPGWANLLSEEQINDIVAYVRSMRTTAEPKFFFISAMRDSLNME